MEEKLKILHSIGLWNLAVEEKAIGGTETFTYSLDKELAKRGIDSRVITWCESMLYNDPERKRIIPFIEPVGNVEQFLYQSNGTNLEIARYATELEELQKGKYDLVHSQTSNSFRFGKIIGIPIVTTIHMPPESFWDPEIMGDLSPNNTFVCVSNSQKRLYEKIGYRIDCVIPNGINVEELDFSVIKDNYLMILGRICPEKGAHIAIEVAKRTGLDLIIAGGVDGDLESQRYFNEKIKPNIDFDLSSLNNKYQAYKNLRGERKIIYVGRVDRNQKKPLLTNAKAFLMPIQWEEPFGLTIVEALVSGTPVIGFNCGAIPEIVEDGREGFVVENVDEMIKAVGNIEKIKPKNCRRRVLDNFTIEIMTDQYVDLYKSLIN